MKKNVILICFIVLKFIIQYCLIGPEYELHRDEFLHLDQANHLAWGYSSVPPFTSCTSYIIKLLGNTVFWIKFFPALYGALTILVVWKAIEALKGDLFALIFGASCVTFSVLFRLNTLYQPNSLDVLCWTIFYYCVIKYLTATFQQSQMHTYSHFEESYLAPESFNLENREASLGTLRRSAPNSRTMKWALALAITFAVGFLNKYNIFFLILGIIPAVLISPERILLKNRDLHCAIAIAFLLILPNLVWQISNNFPVIHHFKELSATQLVNVNTLDFIKSQFLFFPITFLVIFFGLYALWRHSEFRKYRLFFWSFFITIGIFMAFKAKHYYAIGLYPIYFAFGAVYISSLMKKKRHELFKVALVVGPVVLFIPSYFIAFPNNSPQYIVSHPEKYKQFGLLTWEDGREHELPQDFADMLGWKELARKVDSLYRLIPRRKNTLILCDNYGQAGAINYYSKIGLRAVSFNADYLNWFDLDRKYYNLIRVKNASERNDELRETSPYFKQSFKADSVNNIYAREDGTTIFCFIDANTDINKQVRKEVEEEQKRLKNEL